MGGDNFMEVDFGDLFSNSPNHDKFCLSLGKFIDLFAVAELILFQLVVRYGDLDLDIAKAILSPLRIDTGINHINRIIEVKRMYTAESAEIKYNIQQLSVINKMRNDLLHLGVDQQYHEDSGCYFITNSEIAHAPHLIKHIPISADILNYIIEDLTAILLCFLCQICEPIDSVVEKPMRIVLAGFRRANPLGARISWRYKPSSPGKSNPPPAKERSKGTKDIPA